MATKPTGAKEGAPRWTYVAGALVTVAGLAWGIVSYFIPKPEPPKAVSPPVPAPSVSVSGNGNVGVGTMSGGQIWGGAPATQSAQAARVPPKVSSAP